MQNQAKQDQLAKEYALHMLAQAYVIALPTPYVYNFWHPWVKNYRGENAIGFGNEPNWVFYTWVDQDLKKQLTGRK